MCVFYCAVYLNNIVFVVDYVASSIWAIMQCELKGMWKAVIVDCFKNKFLIHFAL
jgi:hypothetical protein